MQKMLRFESDTSSDLMGWHTQRLIFTAARGHLSLIKAIDTTSTYKATTIRATLWLLLVLLTPSVISCTAHPT